MNITEPVITESQIKKIAYQCKLPRVQWKGGSLNLEKWREHIKSGKDKKQAIDFWEQK